MVSPKPLVSQPAGASVAYDPRPVSINQPAATTTTRGSVIRVAAPAAAPAAFADLTAAATAYNAMRTALINAGVFQ